MENKPELFNRLLTRNEVEDVFGISRRFLEVAAARGEGPVLVKIGRAVRYRWSDIVSWIDDCAIDPKSKDAVVDPRARVQR